MSSSRGSPVEFGVPDIDAQHRDIFEAAVDLVAALAASERSAATRILDALAHHVLDHFETEERWMRRTRYPRLREHVARHDEFIERLVSLGRDHAAGGTPSVLALRLRNALSWLADHTDEDDRKLARHVGTHAAPAAAVNAAG